MVAFGSVDDGSGDAIQVSNYRDVFDNIEGLHLASIIMFVTHLLKIIFNRDIFCLFI